MTLKDYVENPQLAIAREIYNNKCNSFEEFVSFLRRIDEEMYKLTETMEQITIMFYGIKGSAERAEYCENQHRKLNEFAQSRIGSLITEYTNNSTEELFNEIKKEIEVTGNPFGVKLLGIGEGLELYLGDKEPYHITGDYNIDKAIDDAKDDAAFWRKEEQECIDERENMYNTHDPEVLTLLFEKSQGKVSTPWHVSHIHAYVSNLLY